MAEARTFWVAGAATAAITSIGAPAESQVPAAAAAATYADLADLALAAPVAAEVSVRRATALKPERAPGLRPNHVRFYVEAGLVSLIRAPQSLPARLAYLVDLPRDSKGKAPKLRKGTRWILLAAPVPGRPGELQLVAPDAQLEAIPARSSTIRTIIREASSASAPPRITGIGRAFHVPGAIRGESETQIFLQTARGTPVSLTVLRRPGQNPQWAVALGEIVDEAAAPPERDTLLWYRLACGLPRALPRQSLADADSGAAAAIAADYRLVLERLGPCARSRAGR
ncbi:MAG TPA: hypothetical protein VHM92_05715 [Allosphingosinicella sp.]|nr:hypothetical protein [Allosphingosinicella sp.]